MHRTLQPVFLSSACLPGRAATQCQPREGPCVLVGETREDWASNLNLRKHLDSESFLNCTVGLNGHYFAFFFFEQLATPSLFNDEVLSWFNTVHSLMFCRYKTTKIDLCQIIKLKITCQALTKRNSLTSRYISSNELSKLLGRSGGRPSIFYHCLQRGVLKKHVESRTAKSGQRTARLRLTTKTRRRSHWRGPING